MFACQPPQRAVPKVPVLGTLWQTASVRDVQKTIHTDLYHAVLRWLRTCRQEKGLSMRTVAARLHVRHTWIGKVEQGERRLDLIEYVRLCRELGADPHRGIELALEGLKAARRGKLTPAKPRLRRRVN